MEDSTPRYLKPGGLLSREPAVWGWGWGREVGAGVPWSSAGWCYVPNATCGSPTGTLGHRLSGSPCTTPQPGLLSSREHSSFTSIPSILPWGAHRSRQLQSWAHVCSLHWSPAPPSAHIQGAWAGHRAGHPLLACPHHCPAGSRGPTQAALRLAALLGLEHCRARCLLGWASLSQLGALCDECSPQLYCML